MKPKGQNSHPEYYPLEVTVGEDIFHTYSTSSMGKLLMDVDYRELYARIKDGTNVVVANQSNKNISKFYAKYPGY